MANEFTPGTSLSTPTFSGPKDGIFIRKHTIVGSNIQYDTKVAPTWSASSVVLILKIKPEGKDWDKEVKIFGDYKVSEDGEITGEGTTWRVWDTIRKLAQKHGIDCSYNSDGKMTAGSARGTIEGDFKAFDGLEVWGLSYPGYQKKDGDGAGFSTWSRIFVQFDGQDDEDIKTTMRDSFLSQVAEGWEKKYQPWLMAEWELVPELTGSAKFKEQMKEAKIKTSKTQVGRNAASANDDTFEQDDDLPF
tara:strand:- start:921 stop:1661 length:741 start_codon:yes stop_codon:yes gene_type:complete